MSTQHQSRRGGGAQVYGKTGVYARKLMWRAVAVMAVCAAVLGGSVWVVAQEMVPLVWGVGGGFVGVVGLEASRGKAARARAGVVAENRALRALRKSGSHIICGAMLGSGGDIDLVVLGPVAGVVEVKHGRGRVYVERDGRLKVGHKRLAGNPLGQAKRGAGAVRKLLGTNVVPIVCVVDMEQSPLRVDEANGTIWVCAARDLGRLVASLGAWVTPEQAEQATARILAVSAQHR